MNQEQEETYIRLERDFEKLLDAANDILTFKEGTISYKEAEKIIEQFNKE